MAKITDFKDRIFRSFHKEAAELHDQVSYAFPWSRQWEYPWLLKNVSFNENDVIMDAGGGYCYFSCLLAKRAKKSSSCRQNYGQYTRLFRL